MSSHSGFRLKLVVIALALFYSGLSNAEEVVVNPITPGSLPTLSAPANSSNNTLFPLYPRLDLTGGLGLSGENNFGHADVMAPLLGTTSGIFYADINGQKGKGKSQYIGLGLGGRYAVNDNFMWGGYVFADKSKSNEAEGSAKWTVFNPGLEFMTNHWDGRLNVYLPSGSKTNVAYFTYSNGRPGVVGAEIGRGADMDFGYTFTSLHRLRAHLGGYYYNLDNLDNMDGGEAGLGMPINNYVALQVDDSYDEVQRNTAIFSVRVTLGGIDKFSADPTVQDRLLDPIYRNLGALHTNASIPNNFIRAPLFPSS